MTDEQFTPLAERYMDTVFRVAYSYLRCRDDADDVTQDVLIQLYRQDKAFESDAHVKNWLIRVTVNRCKNVLRAPWHKAEDIADYENTLVFEQPQYRELFDAVMSLDRRYRLPVLLYYYEGYRQLENGVGMLRSLGDDFLAALEGDRRAAGHTGGNGAHPARPRQRQAETHFIGGAAVCMTENYLKKPFPRCTPPRTH